MIDEQLLRDVFDDRADEHADPADVLAEIHQRLDGHRHPTALRATAMLGAAAAVAAVAVGISTVRESSDHRPGAPAGQSAPSTTSLPVRVASRKPAVPPVLQTPNPSPSSSAIGIPGSAIPYSSIAAGWLPGSGHQIEADHSRSFEERDYAVTVDGTAMDVIIYVENGTHLPSRTEAGSGARNLTVNGHPACEFVDTDATIVAFNLGNGKIAYAAPSVTATTRRVTTVRITRIALHVARAMQFDRHDPIPTN